MNNHGGMVEKYILSRAQIEFARRKEKLGSISTAPAATTRQNEIRRICSEIIGPLPERGPLNVQNIQTLERDGYNLEILTYQSLPGVIVTANLYVPLDRPAPYPAVLCLPGEWTDGKARGDIQRLGRLLSRRGIAALVIDLTGQGERLEYYDSTLRRSWLGKTVQAEWAQLGNPLLLTGHNLAAWLAWDAMRALDLLLTRGGIDAQRIGLNCAPGIENLGLLMCCLDERIKAAAVAADNLVPESLGGDAEQNLLEALPKGVTQLDLLVPFAPKPLLLMHSPDRMPGHCEAALAELRHWYGLLGKSEAISALASEPPLAKEGLARAKLSDFFAKTFGLPDDRSREVETPPEAPEALYATETGQVSNSLNVVSVFGYHKNVTSHLPPPLVVPKDAASAKSLQAEVRERFAPFLRMPAPASSVQCAVESHSTLLNYAVEKGRLEIEEGLFVPYSLFTLPESDGSSSQRGLRAVLALHERGIAGVSNQAAWMAGFAEAGINVLAIDVAGIGETKLQSAQETRMQPTREVTEAAYESQLCGPESQWARRALNAGLSLFGLRVFSVMRSLSWLRTRYEISPAEISIVGVGRGGLWGMYAAALDGEVSRVAALRTLSTYKCLIEHRRHNHHFSLYLPGCLREFDLPHVAACIAPRPLTLINSINQRKDRCEMEALQHDYALTNSIYKVFAAATGTGVSPPPGKFQIVQTGSAPETLRAVRQAIGV